MKKRYGYVSNSSTSSCIILGKKLGNIWHDPKLLETFNANDGRYVLIGCEIEDGQDVIILTEQLRKYFLKAVKEHMFSDCFKGFEGTLIKAAHIDYSPDGMPIPSNLPEGTCMWEYTAEDASTDTLKKAKERYNVKNSK